MFQRRPLSYISLVADEPWNSIPIGETALQEVGQSTEIDMIQI